MKTVHVMHLLDDFHRRALSLCRISLLLFPYHGPARPSPADTRKHIRPAANALTARTLRQMYGNVCFDFRMSARHAYTHTHSRGAHTLIKRKK